MRLLAKIIAIVLCLVLTIEVLAYPIDGYAYSGIRRLLRLQRVIDGEIKDSAPKEGALKSIDDIKLNLLGAKGDSLDTFPEPDAALQKAINSLFPNLNESYSITVLDISPYKPLRYAKRKEDRGFQPGSVGKLAVIAGFFCELESVYPASYDKRLELMKSKVVRAGKWALPNQHPVPFFDPETNKYVKRLLQEPDTFTLFEWTDHMLSVSSNGAASVVWREALLMRAFGPEYPNLTASDIETFFDTTARSRLTEMAMQVVNEPLRDLGITEDEWRLGSFFTRNASAMIPGKGGSIGTPYGLMKYLVALERGKIVDEASSLEIKRLLYMTDRRIRYAASRALDDAAVYFKSGSLYSCKEEEGYDCGKYRGNRYNYMNSVAIVERPDSVVYMVALMSNVLKKNSANDHYGLASQIDRIMGK